MRLPIFLLALLLPVVALPAAGLLPIEKEVAELVKSPKPTVLHFWAPWCPNCYAELSKNGWSNFIAANKDVNFVFITTWSSDMGDGRAVLQKAGVGPQKNFKLLLHPNGSRREEEKMKSFLGLPVTWLPATWVYRDGKLLYALNYGEVRFPVLQQLINDATADWER
jgi:thiol-disulfide isomerase/thioredoxin